MPYPLGAVAVQAGQTYPVPVGSTGTVGAVVIANESPYSLQVSANSSGTGGQWIVAQTVDLVTCDTTSFNGTLSITTDNYLSNAVYAPSFLIYLTAYAPGEQIRGTYPAPLMRLSNGGTVGTPSNTLEQDMWTPFVLSGITPSHTGNSYQTTTGVAFLRQSDNSLLRISVNATAQNLTGISTTYYHDLNPDGSFSLGTSHSAQPNYLTIATIVTNASGNITTLTDTRVMSPTLWNAMLNAAGAPGVNLYNLHVFKDIQADDVISVQGNLRVTSGATGEGFTFSMSGSSDFLNIQPAAGTSASVITFYVNPNGTPPLTAVPVLCLGYAASVGAVQIDTGGVVHANAPITLVGGYQETGHASGGGVASAASQNYGFSHNFKTTLTNAPTSITLTTVSGPFSCTTGTADIDKYGFTLLLGSTAAAAFSWYGRYTTVGNCLLAVNVTAGTFDHHCDACDHVSTAAAFATLRHTPQPSALAYECPACGATECFNTLLTAADEADTAPQGSGQYATTRGAQASLIRSLMTALGLPVAA